MRRLALVISLLVVAACGDGGTGATSTVPTTAEPSRLPPHTLEDLAPILQPLVGEEYTISRASLIDTSDYQPTPTGTHLAVYLEPMNPLDFDDYASEMVETARTFLPFVFERWPGLLSFDVCLEPYGFDRDGTPPSMTIINVTREKSEPVDWAAVDLSELLDRTGQGFTVWASNDVRHSSTWQQAEG